MVENLIPYFNFTIIVFGLILSIDLMINFKKPFILKILLFLIIGGIIIHNLSLLFNWQRYNVDMLSRFLIIISTLNFLNYLFTHNLSKKLLIFCLGLFCLFIFNLTTKNIDSTKFQYLTEARIVTRICSSLIFSYLFTTIYLKLIGSLDEKNLYAHKIKKWIRIVIVVFTIGIINSFVYQFWGGKMMFVQFTTAFTHLTICILMLYRPQFINRTELSITLGKAFKKSMLDQVDEDKFIYEFYTKQYYANKDVYIDEFAKILNVNTSVLIDFVYQSSKMTFIDLVNKKRVEYFINLAIDESLKDLSIEGIAEKAGFGSRQSLYRYFKKFHGGSPSDLIRLYQKTT